MTPIAIDLQTVHAIELPRQHATQIIEISRTVLVAALLRQLLQYPVAISRAAIQQQRHLVLHDRYFESRLAGEHTNTGRTRKLLHVSLLRVDLQHTTDSTSIFHRNARLEQFHILNRI